MSSKETIIGVGEGIYEEEYHGLHPTKKLDSWEDYVGFGES